MLGQALAGAFSDLELFTPEEARVDITDAPRVRDYLFAARPGLIINAAGHERPEQTDEPAGYLKAMAVNGWAVETLARAARLLAAPLIHFSTSRVFAGQAGGGFSEYDRAGPGERLSGYGRSKLLGEKLLLREGGKFYLIRAGRLFGRANGAAIGRQGLVEAFLKEAGEEIFLKAPDAGASSLTYVPDLARAARELWDGQETAGAYHLVNEGAASAYQIAKTVVARSGRGAIVRPVQAAGPDRVAFQSCYPLLLNTKRPRMRPWQEALGEYIGKIKN